MEEHPVSSPTSFQKFIRQKNVVIIGVGILVVIFYIAFNIGIWIYAKNTKKVTHLAIKNEVRQETPPNVVKSPIPTKQSTPTITPTPTPSQLTSKGVYDFSVSAGAGTQTLITGGTLDPVDPPIGGKQNFEVRAAAQATNLYITLKTDTKEKKVTLSKDPVKPDTWRGSWTMDDTYLYIYTVRVFGSINGKGMNHPIMLR